MIFRKQMVLVRLPEEGSSCWISHLAGTLERSKSQSSKKTSNKAMSTSLRTVGE